ncbi:MAG: putative bifunctional diguanylate cyclase/phosphodiesterase [Alphaproteobacteria bacterium]
MLRSVDIENDLAELERLRAAIEASGDLAYDWDLATDTVDWIGRAADVFGVDSAAAPQTGDRYSGRINPEDLPVRMHALSEHFAGTASYDCEYRIRGRDGEFQWVHDRGAVRLAASGTPMRMSGSLRLITERKQEEAQLERQANYDDLTGHFNKLRLREALDYALAYSQRYDQPGAFLAVGIDQLDKINTAFGCETGDRVLVEIAQRLDQALRTTDVIGRLGSDCFGVVLGYCSNEDAVMISERIIQSIRQGAIDANGARVHATVSIGVVFFPEQSKTCFDVITKAEGALLKAKSAGRDCVEAYRISEEQRRNYRANMELGEQVTEAMKDERLVFAYQPIVDAATHEVSSYECLLRMYSPKGELIPAGHFVPVVERLGLMRTLDRRALDLTLQTLEMNPEITLAFNISGVTAADRSWLRTLIARLKDRPDLANRLIVEITETAALHDLEDSARFVSIMRDLGCQVAIDDFGAGYTTFRHLKALTVDIVKIDGSFVRNLADNTENQLFIRNLLSLARAFNLVTVAECVETLEDAKILAREGVDQLQGYYFGKPEVEPAWRIGLPAPQQGTERRRANGAPPGGNERRRAARS